MIPKIIHYCWFGGNPKSELIEKCIESWKKYCLDFEIREWNETNFDVSFCQYTKEAYEAKKWAFVSDVVRLWAVYNYGGIYLDTDVELHKKIDKYLEYEGYFVFENARVINTGAGFGAEKQNKIVGEILKDYLDRPFIKGSKMDLTTCPTRNTKIIKNILNDLELNNSFQIREGIVFFSTEQIQEISTHHYVGSWGENTFRSKKKYRNTLARKVLRSRKIMRILERGRSKKILEIYQFFAYDFIDFGLLYYVQRYRRKRDKRNDT